MTKARNKTGRRTLAATTSISDAQLSALVKAGHGAKYIRNQTGLSEASVIFRAKRLGIDDFLDDFDFDAVAMRKSASSYCSSEISALNAAHPGEAYRDLGSRRVLPPTNPPILRYAA